MMKIRFKVLLIIVEILLFLSFFLTWFSDGDLITLRGVDLHIFIVWLFFFYIGTWFSVFSLSKKFHIISLIASICVFLLEIYKFFTWHYLTITGYISLTFSLDMTSFGFYLSLFICFSNIILKIIWMKLCIKSIHKNEKEIITK
ncbi:hypothetical protein [Longibaculum muris]|uniref:hypothetical protein n=1 Tax=Longibaculum muris TaxID=1796628 RepID=UPI0012B7736F|nr:hypothetical protein [Longibaculum muris]